MFYCTEYKGENPILLTWFKYNAIFNWRKRIFYLKMKKITFPWACVFKVEYFSKKYFMDRLNIIYRPWFVDKRKYYAFIYFIRIFLYFLWGIEKSVLVGSYTLKSFKFGVNKWMVSISNKSCPVISIRRFIFVNEIVMNIKKKHFCSYFSILLIKSFHVLEMIL